MNVKENLWRVSNAIFRDMVDANGEWTSKGMKWICVPGIIICVLGVAYWSVN